MTVTNPVVWFEVMGQDADKLRSFYADLLGWRFEVIKEMDYGTVEAGEGGIAGGIGQAPEGRGWATFYTKVPNLEASVAQAQKLGSSVRVPITELPDTRIAVVTDPEGNAVGLCADKA
jgi:predicted enzyme related to lactoylglutathione lyase